jgi:hypothetical protein
MILVAVGEEMLEQSGGLPVLGMVALEPFNEGDRHGAAEERILAVDFFAAAPAGIARKIGLRTPEHEKLAVVFCGLGDEAGFIAFDAGGLANHLRVPRLANAGRLGKQRCGNRQACAARLALNDSVNTFGGAVTLDTKPWNGGANTKALDLLPGGHQREEIVDPFLHGQLWIVERIGRLLRKGRREAGNQKTKQRSQMFLTHPRIPLSSNSPLRHNDGGSFAARVGHVDFGHDGTTLTGHACNEIVRGDGGQNPVAAYSPAASLRPPRARCRG